MKDYKSKNACFEIEEKEYKMNLDCEQKFAIIVYAHQNDIPCSNELLENQPDRTYTSSIRIIDY